MFSSSCKFTFIALFSFASLAFAKDYNAKRVSIKNGEHTIDGLLLLPSDSAGRAPALIFFGGSGQWEIVDTYLNDPKTSYANFLSFYFKDYIENQKGAILLLNKRGMGRSSGKYGKSSLSDRASDGAAAVEFLKNSAWIDPAKIFVVGHSQGGWVVQMLAGNKDVAGAISFAGPTVGVKEQTYMDYKNQFDCLYGAGSKKSNRKFRAKKRELRIGARIGKLLGGSAAEYARMVKYSNEATLRKIKAPTLFIFGEKDLLVPPAQNLEAMQRVFSNTPPKHIQTWTGANLNHAFHEVDSPCTEYMKSLSGPESEQLQQKLSEWLSTNLSI